MLPKWFSSLRPAAYRTATWAYAGLRGSATPRSGLRVLMYHSVGTPIEDDDYGLFNMKYGDFERQMRYLASHYAGNLTALDSFDPGRHAFQIALTFDDGYRDNLSTAAPLLAELGIPFTVFMISGAVAGRKTGFLGPEDVRELAGYPGATIGSHTVSHLHLTSCDDRKLREELTDSKAYLEQLLGKEVNLLSYPYGFVDRRVRNMAEAVGYKLAGTTRMDINQANRDALLLCRTGVWAKDDLSVFEQKLRGDWDWFRWRHADPAS